MSFRKEGRRTMFSLSHISLNPGSSSKFFRTMGVRMFPTYDAEGRQGLENAERKVHGEKRECVSE